jgi:hypothetical protein
MLKKKLKVCKIISLVYQNSHIEEICFKTTVLIILNIAVWKTHSPH